MTRPASQTHAPGGSSAVTVSQLTDEYRSGWDDYVRQSPDSTVYHLLGLKDAIEDEYGAKTAYLLAVNDSKRVVGVLPMVALRFPWLTNALVSMPYSAYGGALANSDRVALALLREAESVRASAGLGCLFTKTLRRIDFEAFTSEQIHYSMILETNRSFENVWRKSFTKSCRNHCNKAARLGAKVELGDDDTLLRDFYALYVDQQHRYGTPMHSIGWYRQLRRHLRHHVIFGVTYLSEKPAAAVCAFTYRNRIISSNSAQNPAFSSSGANNLLRHELIRHACTSGIDLFDFARSKRGSGTYHFKWSFGARPTTTYYQYALTRGQRMPSTDPSNPAFKLPAEVWKHLPRFLVRKWGPMIRKSLAT
jgi:FemAB-related protein (PEP-CTERM system-associated)